MDISVLKQWEIGKRGQFLTIAPCSRNNNTNNMVFYGEEQNVGFDVPEALRRGNETVREGFGEEVTSSNVNSHTFENPNEHQIDSMMESIFNSMENGNNQQREVSHGAAFLSASNYPNRGNELPESANVRNVSRPNMIRQRTIPRGAGRRRNKRSFLDLNARLSCLLNDLQRQLGLLNNLQIALFHAARIECQSISQEFSNES